MTLIAVVLACAVLIALIVIGLLALVCVHLYNARRRKVRQLVELNRELAARELALNQLRAELARRLPRQSPTIGDRDRRGPEATVQFAPAAVPVMGRPAGTPKGISS